MVQDVLIDATQWQMLLQQISNVGFYLAGVILALIVAATWKG